MARQKKVRSSALVSNSSSLPATSSLVAVTSPSVAVKQSSGSAMVSEAKGPGRTTRPVSKWERRSVPPVAQTPLGRRMLQDMQLVGHSISTQESYLRAVKKLAGYCRTSPDQITEDQLRRYLLHLRNEKQFAAGSLKVAYQGIRFFFTHTVRRDWQTLKQLKVPRQRTLPAVLSREEVRQLIESLRTPHNRAFVIAVYSLGLRLQEGLHLQVGDIDARRMLVHVHRGKGAKDRYVPLPQTTLDVLRDYWKTHRNPVWLFPATGRDHQQAATANQPMAENSPQGCLKKVVRELGWAKRGVSLHTLRHSYATHLLESGVSLRLIQKYLGHSSLLNTTVYLHLTSAGEEQARVAINALVSHSHSVS